MPEAHAKGKRWNWDTFVPLRRRGFTRNGSLDEGTMVGVLTSGMMMGMVLNGVKIVNKHMSHRYAHFHLKAENV